jgi:hypothetical protein
MVKIKKFSIYFLLVQFLLLLGACSSIGVEPEQALWGKWRFSDTQDGDIRYCVDLEFTQDNQLSFSIFSLSESDPVNYVVIAPGRMKITTGDESEIIQYELTDDVLRLYFVGGFNEYSRVQQVSFSVTDTDNPEEAFLTQTDEQEEPIATITQAPIILEPTFTSTIEIPTPTSAPIEEITAVPLGSLLTPTPVLYYPINNCAPSHLHVGDSAYISCVGKDNFRRSDADNHSSTNIIGTIFMGEVIEILDGPECSNGWTMWKVRTTRNEKGWTAETDNNDRFFVIPITTRQLCPNALPTRLIVGGKAKVMESPDDPNSVRISASVDADRVGMVYPGEIMQIIDGPKCGDGSHWWKIQSANGNVTGWTREGDAGRYFLAPFYECNAN